MQRTVLTQIEYAEAFSDACDALHRALFGEEEGIDPDDDRLYVSEPARVGALAVMNALGIEAAPTEYPVPSSVPVELEELWHTTACSHYGDEGAFREEVRRFVEYLESCR